MAKRALPNLGLIGNYAVGDDDWGDDQNANLLKLSALVQGSVLGRVAAVPANPAQGDVYILTADPNGKTVAVFDGAAWVYYAPAEGWLLYDRGTDEYVSYDGAAWTVLETGGGGAAFPPFEGNAGKVLAVNEDEDGVEWVTAGSGEGGGGGVPVPALASARYWRMQNARSTDGTPSAAEIQFRETAGGPAVAPTGVSSTSNNGDQVIEKAFDGNNNTVWSAGRPDNVHIVVDFGQAKTIAEIAVTSRSDVGLNANLRDFDLYYSDDGKVWEHAGFISLPPFTGNAQTLTAAVPLVSLRADKGNSSVVGHEAGFNYPDLTGFTWANQRGAVVSADKLGTKVVAPFVDGGTYSNLTTDLPAGDFDLYMRMATIANQTIDYPAFALAVKAGTRVLSLGFTPGNRVCYLQDTNDAGGNNGNRFNRPYERRAEWYRLQRVGDILSGYVSSTGLEWSKVGQSNVAGLVFDRYGISYIPSSNPDNLYRVLHLSTTPPTVQEISAGGGGGGGAVAAGYRKLKSINLEGLAAFSFDNIPQTGKSLRLVISGKLTAGSDIALRMNGIADGVYDTQRAYENRLRQDGVASDHFRGETQWSRFPTFNGTDNPATAVVQLDFDNYTQTNSWKTGMFAGRQPDQDATAAYAMTGSFQARVNAAIASLQGTTNGATFAAGATATLYVLGEDGPPVDEGASSGGDLVTGWRKTSDGWLEQWGRIVPGGGNQDINFPVPFTQGVAAITGACIEGTDNINTLFAINFSAITLTKFRAHPRFATNGNVNNPGEAFNWFARGR